MRDAYAYFECNSECCLDKDHRGPCKGKDGSHCRKKYADLDPNWNYFYGKDCGCRTCQRYLEYVDSLAQKQEEPKMKIAGHDVTEVTRESAKVGCTRVTLAEAEKLVAEMKDVPIQFVHEGYEYMSKSDSRFANFTLCDGRSGFVNVENYRHYDSTKANMCLNRGRAKELLTFLQDYFQRFPEAK